MNKAFVREPEDTGQANCPRCGSAGVAVQLPTLEAHLTAENLRSIAESAYFCPFARCDVAYFDAFERVVLASETTRPIYPKDPAAPLCGCFGVTTDAIDQDIAEGVVTRTRELVARSKSAEAQCERLAADGRSCAAEAQRYYMRARGETGS